VSDIWRGLCQSALFQTFVLLSTATLASESFCYSQDRMTVEDSRTLLMQNNTDNTPASALSPSSSQLEGGLRLPEKVGAWSRSPLPRLIDAKSIFDYMDGAGELYLGYRFKSLEVYNYVSTDQDEILVELYWMETSDDAFGLLSGDWGGEPIKLPGDSSAPTQPSKIPPHRLLYGAGLLRIWADTLYARVMAERETEASRECVLTLGRAITAGRKLPPVPTLTSVLPELLSTKIAYRLRPDRVCYFRSHLVLNSVYFLSTENILDLGPKIEAVTAEYASQDEGTKPPVLRLFLVRYPDELSAKNALKHFVNGYLPENKEITARSKGVESAAVLVEDGWLAFFGRNNCVVLCFEAPNRETAESALLQVMKELDTMEVSHE
jgi:hypothetical protein